MAIQLLPNLSSTDLENSGDPLQYALIQLKGHSITSDGLPARRQALGSIRVPESTRTASQVSVQRIQFIPDSYFDRHMTALREKDIKKPSQEETVSKKIRDVYTAQEHTSLVKGLSPEQWTAIHDRSYEEGRKVESSYHAGYLHDALQQHPTAKPPVFRAGKQELGGVTGRVLQLIEPSGRTFVFAGSPHDLKDAAARANIVKGKYIRCPSELGDVILTGVRTKASCTKFVTHLLRDMAHVAAAQDLEYVREEGMRAAKWGEAPRTFTLVLPSQPYSDTPVFVMSTKDFQRQGDLANLPQSVKQEIGDTHFVACPFVSMEKTRLSHGIYKPVGAIIAGTENRKACEALSMQLIKDSLPGSPSRR